MAFACLSFYSFYKFLYAMLIIYQFWRFLRIFLLFMVQIISLRTCAMYHSYVYAIVFIHVR